MSRLETDSGSTTRAAASAERPGSRARSTARSRSSAGLATVLRVGLSRIRYETRIYFRTTDSVFFTFLFPFIMLAIFTAAFGSSGNVGAAPDGTGGISVGAYYLPGMLAAGMLLSGVQNLAVDIAGEKGDGTLKRLGGTPLSPLSYFIGKIGQVLVTGIFQAALLILVARVLLGIDLPTEPGKWLTFAWVFLFGVVTCAFLGIALSALPRSGKSATAVVIPIVLILQFISGVYLQFYLLPDWMQNLASVFPLKWMAQGMRGVFLPDSFASLEQSGAWDFPLIALNLAIWLVVGLVLSRVTFRWIRKDT
ncbi:ABC transporter permease [Cryobacterium sp. TMT1-21]|uniref:Transport permease protein n=1 Tax=Cryobacterium shii TaxID=1259235 RepID=A0AAQ2C6E4_9MICO|nr:MULTISPECIES: ABC transporter permease [Cryobacterium]TFC48229.1 ABC transporter permease [Cryobacterium shii]TFD12705.1 ABC transporter permease [Cryobacterium sp. TMT1-21]TFD16331.1 ABC transporter permease [Cryobacterium sp. TMT2-23]TFD41187.1 ABC transporter permease [Cryobacterium sp. TMT2-10]